MVKKKMQSLDQHAPNWLEAASVIAPGMFVRVPIDSESATTLAKCRDFRIGKVISIQDETCKVSLDPADHDPYKQDEIEIHPSFVRRCRVAPGPFIHTRTLRTGTILTTFSDDFRAGELLFYFVLLDGSVQAISEAELNVESFAQLADPKQQIAEYEFHPAIWKSKRDQILQSYIEMQSATFGVEELVGSRILLLPHQAETIARVLGDRQCRYVLADEVGLGKTVEAAIILKGLRRRNPTLKTIILTPHTLINQWHQELDRKFWLRFSLPTSHNHHEFDPNGPGILLSIEDLKQHPKLADNLLKRQWDLLIIDEAHRLQHRPDLYQAVLRLSEYIDHSLVLSATPILRRGSEYLSLLRLMNPQHYGAMSDDQFEAMLMGQSDLRKRLAYVGRGLNPEEFDAAEFHEEIDPLIETLQDDVLFSLLQTVSANSSDRGLNAAREVHSYLSENYRIENRVIRNRRASLEGQLALPKRILDEAYRYVPTTEERETLAELLDYAAMLLAHNPEAVELARGLCYAAASSPVTLERVIRARMQWITTGQAPISGMGQIGVLVALFTAFPDEQTHLERLLRNLGLWMQSTESALNAAKIRFAPRPDAPHRLLQVLRAVYDVVDRAQQKVLIFCRWADTQLILEGFLRKHFGSHKIAVFKATKGADDLQHEVDRFQSDPECQIMLSDESGGEGRNFQIASTIIHADLPWMPAQIEQRIGRVDRIGREGEVRSIVPYAQESLEADLFQLWNMAFSLFTRSMSGMEIVLESIQDEIIRAFASNPHDGLKDILSEMMAKAQTLRDVVEEERYAEESSAQFEQWEKFAGLLDAYQDGEKLKRPLLKWADFAGIPSYSAYDRSSNVQFTIFDPKQVAERASKNAKFVNPPNMEEALRRSGRQRNLVIRGTFNRHIAVQREDVVFFAPGELWTDALIQNALYADRGQSAAIKRFVPGLEGEWEGFDCLFSIRVNPRPLLESGLDPVHLFAAQGYLTAPCYRIVFGLNGEVIRKSSLIWQHIEDCQPRAGDVHLGKRSGDNPALELFMERYSHEHWHETVLMAVSRAQQQVRDDYSFVSDLADEAQAVFERRILGQRTAHRWLHGEESSAEIDEYERIVHLLLSGISAPKIQLESMCYWWLCPEDTYA